MIPRRRIALLVVAALAACESAVKPDDGTGTLSLQVTTAAGAVVGRIDSGHVIITNGQSTFEGDLQPGESRPFDVPPGVYAVVVEGMTGGQIESYAEMTDVRVTAGANTSVHLTLVTFVPTIGTVASTVIAGQALSVPFQPVNGADKYVIQASTNAGFTGSLQTAETSGSPGSITFATAGSYFVRVRAVDRFGRAGVPSSNAPVTAAPPIQPLNNHIAFASDQTGSLQVWVAPAAGGPAKQLTNGAPAFRPDISPDGLRILYDLTAGPSIAVMNADGSGTVPLGPQGCEGDWSPDGTEIAFVTTCTTKQVLGLMNADGSNPRELTSQQALSPRFSPDGQRIVFYSSRDGNDEIYVIDRDGSNETRLTDAGVPDFYPSFSPDGTKIIWSRTLNGIIDIWSMNPDGTGKVQLTSNNNGQLIQPDWSPGRERIVFQRDNALYTVMANGGGLTQIPITGITSFQGGHRWGPCLDASCAPTTGQIEVRAATTGAGTDADGFLVSVGGGPPLVLPTAGAITFVDEPTGVRNVSISDIAPNCTLSGSPTETVSVTAGRLTVAPSFPIDCIQNAANRVVVVPQRVRLRRTGSRMFVYGTPFDANGNPEPGFIQLTFTTSNPAVATVDASGEVMGQGPGTATITVTDGGSRSGTVEIEVSSVFTNVINYLGHSYAVTADAVNWVDATQLAREWGAHSVVISDAAETGFLAAALVAPLNQSLWIGLSDRITEDYFEWVDTSPHPPGSTTAGPGFADWRAGEPNGGPTQNCVHMDQTSNGQWNDIGCGNLLRGIVEWDYTGPIIIERVAYHKGHRYAVTRVAMSFSQARNLAESLGGTLATIDDAEENQFLVQTYSQPLDTNLWFGFSDYFTEGSFRWLTGKQPVGYTNWGPDEPNDNFGDEDCAEISAAGDWNDLQCAVPLRAIIEWESYY